jgi:hypothetical protein
MKSTAPRSASGEKPPMRGDLILIRGMGFIKPMVLPVLLAIVPTLYHYGNNVEKLTAVNLFRMLAFNSLLAIVVYLVFMAFSHFQPIKAANATFVFLIFFNVYGLVYRYLLYLDSIRIKHYTLLPLMLMIAVYAILFLHKPKNAISAEIWKSLIVLVSILIFFNLFKIIPGEIQKAQSDITEASLSHPEELLPAETSPDIYYIILDEFAGFQAMREYWHYEGVDDFVRFLKDRGFFIAEESHGSSTDTLHQVASRLNYQEYPHGTISLRSYFKEIADNRVMRELKLRGYTTVVFDETNMGYPSSLPIKADYVYEYESPAIPESNRGEYGFYFDEFGELVVDNTMLFAFSQSYRKNNRVISQHSSMISFAIENIADPEVPSPKFVYVHLLLPHFPFVFNRNGDITESDQFTNWNHYLENYIYSIQVAEEMIDNIISESDVNNPPVIILQSDHGARNHLASREGSAVLPNYPNEFKSLILYALYIPGYDYSSLPQDIDPINTFPIVFNYLFDTNISLTK